MEPFGGFDPQVGEIRALRTFRIGPGGSLYPLFSNTPWSEGANTARCRMADLVGGGPMPHDVPDPDCSCGFYAYGSEAAAAEYPHARHVLAVVAYWGRVIAGTRGLRAEHGRVEALWLAETVPVELAGQVADRYRSVAIYEDKVTMLAKHPLTVLDCYDQQEPQRRSRARQWLSALVAITVGVGVLPARWLDPIVDARLLWAAAFGVFMVAALALGHGHPADIGVRRRRLLFHALALWMIAPFAGLPGALLVRVPLVQLGALAMLQRHQLRRAAARFPADIG